MIDFISVIVKESSDVALIHMAKEYFDKSMTLMYRRLPEDSEFKRQLGSRATQLMEAINSKLIELEDIPF